ncbi:hypothetical protein Tco_1312905 [Tanacetum coccineum]
MIAKQGTCPSMIRVLVTIRTLVMTNLRSILRISNNSLTVVRENNRILEEMLRIQMPNSPVVLHEPEGSDDYTEVTYDKEKCLSDHYTTLVIPPAYTPSIPETDEFIKSSVDDLVPIPREFEVTSDSVLECDMPATTPLSPTDDGEVDFDINSPLGEQVVDFLMENVDVAGFPRHLEFEDISSLVLPELTPVIDESTLLVTLSLPYLIVLGDEKIDLLLRDDLDTLSTGDREIDFNHIRDIEELERLLANNPVPVPRVFDEPLGNSDSMSRSIETSDLIGGAHH